MIMELLFILLFIGIWGGFLFGSLWFFTVFFYKGWTAFDLLLTQFFLYIHRVPYLTKKLYDYCWYYWYNKKTLPSLIERTRKGSKDAEAIAIRLKHAKNVNWKDKYGER